MKHGNWCKTNPCDSCKQQQKFYKQKGYLHFSERYKIKLMQEQIKKGDL